MRENVSRLEGLKDIMNADGTLGVQNNIKGEILQEAKFGTIKLYHIKKFCPWCPKGIEQPVEQVVIYKGLNNVHYHCQVCCTEYYYLQNRILRMRPEIEFETLGYRTLNPNRKPYELHYMEAVECKWFQNLNYEESRIVANTWTMATEVCAQFFHKSMKGKAPAYYIGGNLLNGEEIKITNEDGQIFQEAYKSLQELNYF